MVYGRLYFRKYFINLQYISFFYSTGIGYLLNKKWGYGVFLLIIHEIIENFFEVNLSVYGWSIISPEPFINIISDLIIGVIGLFVGYKLNTKCF